MWMIERRDGAGFPFESFSAVGVGRKLRGQDLDGDEAIEPGVPRFIHFAHAAAAEEVQDFVRPETRSGYERHGLGVNILSLALGSHPQRELTLMPSAWPLALMAPSPRSSSN